MKIERRRDLVCDVEPYFGTSHAGDRLISSLTLTIHPGVLGSPVQEVVIARRARYV